MYLPDIYTTTGIGGSQSEMQYSSQSEMQYSSQSEMQYSYRR